VNKYVSLSFPLTLTDSMVISKIRGLALHPVRHNELSGEGVVAYRDDDSRMPENEMRAFVGGRIS